MPQEPPYFVMSEQPAWLAGVPGGGTPVMQRSTGPRVLVPTASTVARADLSDGVRDLLPDWLNRALARFVADELLMHTDAAAPVVSVVVGTNYGVRENAFTAAQLPDFCAEFRGDAVVGMHLEIAQRGAEPGHPQPGVRLVGSLTVDIWDARTGQATRLGHIPDEQWSMLGATVARTLGLAILPQARVEYRVPQHLRNEYLLTLADMLSLGLCTTGALDPAFVAGEEIAQRIMAMWPRDITQYPQLRWMLGAMVPWLQQHPSAGSATLVQEMARLVRS